jgi:hypothetical protein
VVQDFYTKPGVMTSAGRYAPLLEALPGDATALTRIVQGLGVYDVVAPDFYGFAIPDGREAEVHIRRVEGMLERLLQLDGRPLSDPRPVGRRLVYRCRNFTLLLLAMLRAKGIPAGPGAASGATMLAGVSGRYVSRSCSTGLQKPETH